jgi:hypothetical protein
MRYPNSKLNVNAKEEFVSDARVQKIDWVGPGWYFIFKYTQKCPRGCCYDDVFEAKSLKKWKAELSEEIRNLEYRLRDVKELEEPYTDEV